MGYHHANHIRTLLQVKAALIPSLIRGIKDGAALLLG